MNDELRKHRVEHAVFVRQRLSRRELDVDPGMTRARRGDEGLGRIDGRHGRGAKPRDELGREGAGAASDIQHLAARRKSCEVDQLRREMTRVQTHESVVRLSGDIEAHALTLATRARD